MPDLAKVTWTLAEKNRADAEYREALEEAIAAGASYAELARFLGVSRQAVRQYVLTMRNSPTQP